MPRLDWATPTALLGLALAALVVITPLTALQQALLGVVLVGAALMVSLHRTPTGRVLVAILAALASTRYIYWRATETLNTDTLLSGTISITMFVAELYLWVVLVLSFTSTIPMRDRKPTPLPNDQNLWPTVDIYIPTYNEDLSVVRATVLAAKEINYPADKFKIYILDDGKRQDFRDFAAQAGVEYLDRPDNKHAKAGNLNHAMTKTDGDLIAIFDCDHVPTNGFLQMTVGGFIANANLALVQTPHYFYNQDAFEKNLRGAADVPNEGLLFYGLIQNGNDFWNASFFCGSCAVIRRTALEQVGGIAVETVTEDAHTSLKLQRRGWDTAYLRQPLASGLATESLSVHIGQRMRWARGMLQIFMLDNPFVGRGLSLAQRVCYANAMIHFMFPLPRLILLIAPLAYLILGQRTIEASAWSVLAYGLPHLIVATISSTIVQGRFRHPLWGEVYETALALHLIRPTLMTFLQPRKGKFNVTSKAASDGLVRLDWSILKWHIGLLAVMIAAMIYGLAAIAFFNLPTDDIATTALNVFWAAISCLFLLVTVAVGVERPGRGERTPIGAILDAVLHCTDGRAVPVQTRLASMGEVHCALPAGKADEIVGLEMRSGARDYAYAQVEDASREGDQLRLAIRAESLEQEQMLANVILGRTNAWASWDQWRTGSFMDSMRNAGLAIGGLVDWVKTTLRTSRRAQLRAAAVTLAVAGLSALLIVDGARAQAPGSRSLSLAGAAGHHTSTEHRNVTLSLDDFGILQPLRLQGSSNTRGVGFTLRSDEAVVSARFAIRVAYSPHLDPSNSQLTISLNGEAVHSHILNPLSGSKAVVEFDVNPYLFLPDNNVVFQLTARRSGEDAACEDDAVVWAQISNTSQLFLTVGRQSLPPDLSYLPRPFFDPRDATALELPFVFSRRPSAGVIKAAAVTASYWGVESHYRGADFPVSFNRLPATDAVVFLTPEEPVSGLAAPRIAGPSLAIVENPVNRRARLLLVMGRNDEELNEAARALSLGAQVFSRESATVRAPQVDQRRAYDAPRWVPTDRPVRLGELAAAQELEGRGVAPGVLGVNFLTAPDFFPWGHRQAELRVRYRAPGEQWIDVRRSRLDVLLNDKFVETLPLNAHTRGLNFAGANLGGDQGRGAKVALPPYLIYGQSQLQFYFDLQVRDHASCGVPPGELRSAIDLDSTADFSKLHRFTQMPNLAFLAQSGFPFTKYADLSETAVVLSPDFREADLEALFGLMGLFGAKTGYPGTRVEILFPGDVRAAADRDILLIGTFDSQPLFADWADAAPVRFSGDIAEIQTRRGPEKLLGAFTSAASDRLDGPARISAPMQSLSSILTSYESPLKARRTVVAMMASTGDGLLEVSRALRSPTRAAEVQGDLITVTDSDISAYLVARPYHVGRLPPVTHVQWWLSENVMVLNGALVTSTALMLLGGVGVLRRRARKLAEHDDNLAKTLNSDS